MSSQERISKLGAVLVAVAASACCWLPLLLVGLGIGATGAGAAFETARPYLMAATVVLLGAAYFFTYRKKTACAEDGSCATAGAGRSSKLMLWVITAIAAVSFVYPYWAQQKLDGQNASVDEAALGAPGLTLAVDGMTCAACAVTIHDAVADLPGVIAVVVEEEPGRVRVWSDVELDADAVADAIREVGYTPRAAAKENSAAGQTEPSAPPTKTVYIEVKGMVQQLGIT